MTIVKRRILLLVTIAVLSIGLCSIIFAGEYSCLEKESAYFRLPASAMNIERHSEGRTRSCTLWLKFEMNPAELSNFVSTTFISAPLSSIMLPKSIGGISNVQSQTAWKLDTISSFLAGEAKGSGGYFLDEQMLVVDTSSAKQYIVYLTTKRNWL